MPSGSSPLHDGRLFLAIGSVTNMNHRGVWVGVLSLSVQRKGISDSGVNRSAPYASESVGKIKVSNRMPATERLPKRVHVDACDGRRDGKPIESAYGSCRGLKSVASLLPLSTDERSNRVLHPCNPYETLRASFCFQPSDYYFRPQRHGDLSAIGTTVGSRGTRSDSCNGFSRKNM